jgi:hypothetical protein
VIDIYNKKNMKFGTLKSKIEEKLLKAYKKDEFKKEMKNFKSFILENKNLSKLFFLYDDLSSNKGLDNSIVDDYINSSIVVYENTLNKIKPYEVNNLKSWLSDIECDNRYTNIDDLFSNDILKLENKVKSKKIIAENLKKTSSNKKEEINLPISVMVNLANKTINNHIESLNESDKKMFLEFFSKDSDTMEKDYIVVKESVLNKLEILKKDSDSDVQIKINETIEKINSEKFDKLNYYRIVSLNDSI